MPVCKPTKTLAEKTRLTQRGAQVLILLGLGLTNYQIAGRLVISPHIVNRHLTNIYKQT